MRMPPTVIVTGGAGFIGSHFLCHMAQKYPSVRFVCFDALTYAANLGSLECIWNKNNFFFLKGDISDPLEVNDAFSEYKPDCVVNFAAESHVDRSIESASPFFKTNFQGTGVLMDACLTHGVKRFHQVSTDEVYGDLPLGENARSFTESSPLCPSSPYAATKAAADLLLLSYVRTYGLPATITRCANNFGPWQYPEKLIPLMVFKAIKNEPLPVYGNGQNERDWIHVLDHVYAIEKVLLSGKIGEIYNVGASCEKKNIDIVKEILRILDKPATLISFVADRKGHDLKYSVDAGKLKTELGWKIQYPFETEFEKTVLWYKSFFTK